MASTKTRRVYFLVPEYIEKDGTTTEAGDDFWDKVHGLLTAAPERGASSFHGVSYRGYARSEKGTDYLYLGKVRPEADYPHATAGPGSSDTSTLTIPGDLLEYLYVRPLGGASSIGLFLRSSGGPSFQAFENWLIAALKLEESERSFQLRPLVREDTWERLKAAQAVSRVDVKFERDGARPQKGKLAKAVETVEKASAGSMSVEIGLSLGRIRADSEAGEDLAQEARKLAESSDATALKKFKVKVWSKNSDGQFIGDELDMVRDRITYRVPVGESLHERPDPDVVLAALSDAGQRYLRSRTKSKGKPKSKDELDR